MENYYVSLSTLNLALLAIQELEEKNMQKGYTTYDEHFKEAKDELKRAIREKTPSNRFF
jgi:hypothetical protein